MSNLRSEVGQQDHLEGSQDAQVILTEYGDYECPRCARAYFMVKRIRKHFGSSLGFVFRNFPLSQIHPHAESAAEVAEFAADQGKFWEMHDLLFENQALFSRSLFLRLADELDLDSRELKKALDEGRYRDRVRADVVDGVRSGVNGTPTFFINGLRHDGDFDFQTMLLAIHKKLVTQRAFAKA